MSSGNTQKQITFLQDMKSDILCCTPSYALTIAEGVKKAGIKPEELNLSAGIFGAEPWTQSMRDKIEEGLVSALMIFTDFLKSWVRECP